MVTKELSLFDSRSTRSRAFHLWHLSVIRSDEILDRCFLAKHMLYTMSALMKTRECTDAIETTDRLAEHGQTAQLFRKVYSLMTLRILILTTVECYAMYDEAIIGFFSGSGGAVVIFMIWLVHIIFSGYTSLSERFGPGKPSNRSRLIALNAMECIVYAGAAANLYHANQIKLVDVIVLNSSLGFFHMGHVLFFLNPWICYHGIYGGFYGVLCFGTVVSLTALNLRSSHSVSGGDPSGMKDDASTPVDWQSLVEIASLGFLCCLWYSLETHVVVWKRHRFRLERQQDCSFVMLCFAYADVWNVMAKCRFFVTKSSETDATCGDVRDAAQEQLDTGNLPDDFRLFSSASA